MKKIIIISILLILLGTGCSNNFNGDNKDTKIKEIEQGLPELENKTVEEIQNDKLKNQEFIEVEENLTQKTNQLKAEEPKINEVTQLSGVVTETDENGSIIKTIKEVPQQAYVPPATIPIQPTCTTNWHCNTWNTCINSQQTRICTDLNNCGVLTEKPSILQSCTAVCISNWQAGSWTTCSNNQQIRTVTDSNNCETITGKPNDVQSCTTPLSISLSTITTKDVSAHIAWNTNIPTNSKVFLTRDDGSIQVIQSASGYSTQHFVDISGLEFSTQYSYTIESMNGAEVKKLTDTILTQPEEFSDYVFNNTSPAVGSATQWKARISIAPTIRDIQIRKAVFKFSDEDAVRLDTMQPCRGDVPFVFSYLLNAQSDHPVAFDIIKINKNTYVFTSLGYPYGSAGGISIPQNTSRPLSLSLCATLSTDRYADVDEALINRALMENIQIPMSEWELWDQSNGKRVDTQ